MTKRVSRKVLALAAIGALASPGIASAQLLGNTQVPVAVSARFVGPIPTGVTGVAVNVQCYDVTTGTGIGNQLLAASFGTTGGSTSLNFGLNPASTVAPIRPGSHCVTIANVLGTTNIGKGGITISVGGTTRTTTTSFSSTGSLTATTADLPVWSSTDIVVTVSYPQITVKKVVNGDEPVAGFAYPMSVSCVNPAVTSPTFIDIAANGNIGNGLVVNGGAGNYITVPVTGAAAGPFIAVGEQAAVYSATTGALITPATKATLGYSPGELVVPGGGYVTVPVYNASKVLIQQVRVWDAKTTGTINAPDLLGSVANLDADVTSGGVTKSLRQWVLEVLWATPATNVTTGVRVYDYRTPVSSIPAGNLLGNAQNLNQSVTSAGVTKSLAAWINDLIAVAPAASIAPVSIALKGGESKSISFNEMPNLTAASQCVVRETNSQGAGLAYSSTVTNADGTAGTPRAGELVNGVFVSSLTNMNETITVTNSFYGDMVISKVVTGDPKTNIATYEISVSCDKGGPKDTFLLKDRQSKVYNNIAAGTNCLITETKSDGAVSSTTDNSGDNTTDGRVVIKRRPAGGCALAGSPTGASPGGPAPTSTFDECFANVIITNDYNPPATTAAPAAAAPATAAPATAAPAVAPAPAVAVEATPTFAG